MFSSVIPLALINRLAWFSIKVWIIVTVRSGECFKSRSLESLKSLATKIIIRTKAAVDTTRVAMDMGVTALNSSPMTES